MSAFVISDSFVSLAAILGLLILRGSLARERSPLNQRFLFGIDVLIAMLLSRILAWTTPIGFFDQLTVVAAGFVPLAALILAEGLLRRHAPAPLKWLAAAGAAIIAFLSLVNLQWMHPGLLYLLMGLQLTVFVSLGYLVVTRDRATLTASENLMVDRLGLSLLLIVPFAITDFRDAFFLWPVRMSGIAILFLCWLALSFSRNNLTHWEIARSFVLVLAAGIAAGLAISSLAGLDGSMTVQITAIIVSAALVAQIYNERRTLHRDEERESILRSIAQAGGGDPDNFLMTLQKHPMVSGALTLKDADLKDFDTSLMRAFDHSPIQRKSELSPAEQAAETTEQLHWFFEKYDATHAMLVSREPRVLVALNMPTLAASPGAELELAAVQRFAAMMYRDEATR
ncbi:MAG: hypothetical protein NXI27_21500 [Alphaproteobacteria bacterium]|nr:hypothetical protein [Alphaproteobacteria bacterium]